jgi:hypothetical protein
MDAKHTVVAPRPGRPFSPGAVLGKVPSGSIAQTTTNLTPLEAKIAQQLNVTPEQLPALRGSAAVQRLSQELMHAAANVSDEELARLQPVKPLAKPPERDISQLSRQEQAEVNHLLHEYDGMEKAAALPDHLQIIPGMAETLQTASRAPAGGIEIVDALPDPTEFSPLKRPKPEPAAEQPAPEPENLDAGATIEHVACQHCGQDLRIPSPHIDAQDKVAYLQTVVLGGDRFRKDYLLFGDRMRVIFRSLLPHEAEMARRQGEKDLADGRVFSGVGYYEKVTDYRLIMSIESIERAGSERLPFEATIDLPTPAGAITPLVQLLTWFNTRVFNTDTVKRAIGQTFQKFERLNEHLETQANNTDFWSAIEAAS